MEDINAILKKAQSGDNEAINLILEEYSKILSFNAQKYYLIGAEQEDLLQEGILGLLKAIKFYDETKSSFSSFAFLCIRREMISAIRKANTQKNMVLNVVELKVLKSISKENMLRNGQTLKVIWIKECLLRVFVRNIVFVIRNYLS